MAGRNSWRSRESKGEMEPAGVSGKTDYRVTRIRGSRGPEPRVREEGRVGTPGVGRKSGARSTSKRKERPGPPGSKAGIRSPRAGVQAPPPRWGHVGRGAEGSAQAVLLPMTYLCPVPGGHLIPHPLKVTVSPHSTATPLPAYPRHGSAWPRPLCAPGPVSRSPRLRSPLLPSPFSRGRRRLSAAQPWSE